MRLVLAGILLGIVWGSIGCGGFAYWWTSECLFTREEIAVLMLAAVLGPFAWIIGSFIHGRS